jgi:hypothetical protein
MCGGYLASHHSIGYAYSYELVSRGHTSTTKEITNFLVLMKFVQNPIVKRTKPSTLKSGRVSNARFLAPLI